VVYQELEIDRYPTLSAAELAHRVAEGVHSPVQLVECALALARDWESDVNAYAALTVDEARAAARLSEGDVRRGHIRGRLHGVPMANKDNIAIKGFPLGKGSRTTPSTPQAESSPMIARLMDAGAIVIGRTTTPEFGWKGTGISPRTGVTRNPWDPTRNSGGSSSGSGVTVATGAVPIATGTDAGGSVRIPASFCGVVGFKPTLGAVPLWPGTVNESLSHAGVISRHVADAALAFSIARGFDPRDPQSAYPTRLPGLDEGRPRVAVVREPFGIAPSDEVARAFESAIDLLAASGVATLESAAIDIQVPRDVFETLWVTGRGLGFAGLVRDHGSVMDPGLARLADLAGTYSLADYYRALSRRREFNAWAFGLFEDWDLLVMPTMPISAFEAELEVPSGGDVGAPLPWITWTPYTYPFNITGQPAISIPMPADHEGLPLGLQIVGPWSADDRVLEFAARCEAVLDGQVRRVAPRSAVVTRP